VDLFFKKMKIVIEVNFRKNKIFIYKLSVKIEKFKYLKKIVLLEKFFNLFKN